MNNAIDKCAHLYIDGSNIDATLGFCLLERKPEPHERPRWDRVHGVAVNSYHVSDPYFVLNGDKFGYQKTAFFRAMRCIGFNVATPRSADWCESADQDPVDEFIKRSLEADASLIKSGELGGVLIVAHDHGYAPILEEILTFGGSVGIVGFCEWFSPELVALAENGADLLDLEHDFGGFDSPLNRPRLSV